MNTDQDKTLNLFLRALHEGALTREEHAWVFNSIVLLITITLMLLLLRWLWSGGLSRHTSFGFFRHRRLTNTPP